MPPSYKPQSVTIPGGVIGESFNNSGTDFEKALAVAQALEAQGLNNDSVQLSVDQRQRAATQSNQFEDELSAQIKAAQLRAEQAIAPMDPTTGAPMDPATAEQSPQTFDPIEGYKLAQKIAMQQGNLGAAAEAARAQRSLQDTRGEVAPLTETQRQFLGSAIGPEGIPEGITSKDLALRGALQRGNIYEKSVNETADKRSDMIQSLAPGGWQVQIDPQTGQGPNKEDGKKFTVATAAINKINSYLDQLDESLAAGGGNDPTDPEFVRQRQLIAAIQVAFKEKNNFGAALTVNEQLITDAQLPRILARNDIGVGRAMIEAGLGRDPRDAISNLKTIINNELETQAHTYKFGRARATQQQAPDVAGAMERGAGTAQVPGSTGGFTPEQRAKIDAMKARIRSQQGS